jgi:membrane associated rhomboid family serine protease
VLAFLVVWFGINLIFGIGSLAIAPMARALPGRRILAHIGGLRDAAI